LRIRENELSNHILFEEIQGMKRLTSILALTMAIFAFASGILAQSELIPPIEFQHGFPKELMLKVDQSRQRVIPTQYENFKKLLGWWGEGMWVQTAGGRGTSSGFDVRREKLGFFFDEEKGPCMLRMTSNSPYDRGAWGVIPITDLKENEKGMLTLSRTNKSGNVTKYTYDPDKDCLTGWATNSGSSPTRFDIKLLRAKQ
jgi:hypothetical protein